jgi:hypothetical protein
MTSFGLKNALLHILALASFAIGAAAQQCPKDDRKCELDHADIQDNSFLVEEAYNQEYGVVQHIQDFQRNWPNGDWYYTFTQEWPVDPAPRNQLSYTIPVVNPGAGGDTGVGDVLLNYRYQVYGSGDTRVAFAPRASLVLPTGDWRRGQGMGSTGVQFMLPLSTVLSKRFVMHWNAGATILPGARDPSGDKADAYAYNFGQSTIWLATHRFNVMLESVFQRNEVVVGPEHTQWQSTALLSPGIRWAWNLRNGLQVVPGVAVPIGVGPSAGQRGVFVYLSFEHPYRKLKQTK